MCCHQIISLYSGDDYNSSRLLQAFDISILIHVGHSFPEQAKSSIFTAEEWLWGDYTQEPSVSEGSTPPQMNSKRE